MFFIRKEKHLADEEKSLLFVIQIIHTTADFYFMNKHK